MSLCVEPAVIGTVVNILPYQQSKKQFPQATEQEEARQGVGTEQYTCSLFPLKRDAAKQAIPSNNTEEPPATATKTP